MVKRRTRDSQSDSIDLVIELDPEEIERKKAQRLYRFDVIQVPRLRMLGFCLLTVAIFFHNLFLLKSFSWESFLEIASILISYSVISWLVLYLFFETAVKFNFAFFFSCG
ncbi:MAG TPA: hypothetical protein VLK82_21965 [Candidatus Tectomicrobia bacterium]|nr:hypothetical protein [Candidatus Tectomicrobia bacterium]